MGNLVYLYHTVLKASPDAAIFGKDMLFDVSFIANWHKLGVHMQHQRDYNTAYKNTGQVELDYRISDKVLLRRDDIFHKTENKNESDPWTIMSVHVNGTIRAHCAANQNA